VEKRKMSKSEKISKIRTKRIPLVPTEDLGYLCGLIIGDGSIRKARSNNYTIQLSTTRKEFRDHFVESAVRVSSLLKSYLYEYKVTRMFPNGSVRSDMMYRAIIDSKALYDALRPFKRPDYHWQVPSFLDTMDAQRGFLQGIFDAEGSVIFNKKQVSMSYIQIASKHKSNLLEIEQLLKKFGIEGCCFTKVGAVWGLRFWGRRNLLLFATRIGFRLKKKQDKLLKLLSSYQRTLYRYWSIEEDNYLRENFWSKSDREIAQSLNRSLLSIRGRRQKLGLFKFKGWRSRNRGKHFEHGG